MQLHVKSNFVPGARLTAWLHTGVKPGRSSIAGSGLFAERMIQVGEVVCRWGGVVFTRDEIQAGKATPDSLAILDENTYLGDPVDEAVPADYSINHSCDPNLWMGDAITLVARREILPGEELTADYALWLYDVEWVLEPCKCGSAVCRGRVTNLDWRLPELQARYKGYFTPFINQLIQLKDNPAVDA